MTPRTIPGADRLVRLLRLARPTAARAPRPGRVWTVPAAVLAGAAAGGAYGLLATPEYAATSYVVVVPEERSDPAAAMGLAQAYGRVATDIAVAGDAAVWARVTPAELRASVTAATSPDAPMISVTARSERARTAAAMADGVARALVQKGAHARAGTHVSVVQFARATTPTAPVSPSAPLAALVGGSGGGLLGGLALLVRPRRAADARPPAEGTAAPATGTAPAPGTTAAAAVPGPSSGTAAAAAPQPETV
ncbi:lipopolysaccharide biosynthesis protein [Streptomyces sp. DH12]|uniref:lipopolysaccharide biosynthesis protein n=1 Tax=Streptomyces sp. DH12 TaxID=2857010 RepID=UPI001E28F97E|nr:lipopolysaccharide biosynthesis protein [Streptomyces sp. DH12]